MFLVHMKHKECPISILEMFSDFLGEIPGYVKRVWKEHQCEPLMKQDELDLIKKYTVSFFSFSYYRSSTYDGEISLGDTGGLVGKENPYLEGCSREPWCWQLTQKESVMF